MQMNVFTLIYLRKNCKNYKNYKNDKNDKNDIIDKMAKMIKIMYFCNDKVFIILSK